MCFKTHVSALHKNCKATMEDWLHTTANGTDSTHSFVPTTMAFSKCFRHPCRHATDFLRGNHGPVSASAMDGPYPHSQQDQNSTVAAFMIARPASGLLQLHVHGAYAWAEDLNFPAILQTDFGPPLSPASAHANGKYSREFRSGTVTLDCVRWSSSFVPRH